MSLISPLKSYTDISKHFPKDIIGTSGRINEDGGTKCCFEFLVVYHKLLLCLCLMAGGTLEEILSMLVLLLLYHYINKICALNQRGCKLTFVDLIIWRVLLERLDSCAIYQVPFLCSRIFMGILKNCLDFCKKCRKDSPSLAIEMRSLQ